MTHKNRISPITRVENDSVSELADELVIEAPLAITLISDSRPPKSLAVTMRSPGDDEFLCAGFLLTEGIIESQADIKQIRITHQGADIAEATVELSAGFKLDPSQLERNIYTHSSCGICSKPTLESIEVRAPSLEGQAGPILHMQTLYELPDTLRTAQASFSKTGGIHAAALIASNGTCLMTMEDVGRHNAVDKLIGKALLDNKLPLHQHALLLSGRGGFELIQKAHVAGIPVVIALGAPTSMAVSLAHQVGMTLVGFLKNDRFNIYTHPRRIDTTQRDNP